MSYCYFLLQVSECSLDLHLPTKKTNLIAEWTAKHSISPNPDQAALARRKLPVSPGKSSPESTDDSLVDANQLVATKDKHITGNTRPFEGSTNLSPKKMGTQPKVQRQIEKDLNSQQEHKPVWRSSSKGSSSSSIPKSALDVFLKYQIITANRMEQDQAQTES